MQHTSVSKPKDLQPHDTAAGAVASESSALANRLVIKASCKNTPAAVRANTIIEHSMGAYREGLCQLAGHAIKAAVAHRRQHLQPHGPNTFVQPGHPRHPRPGYGGTQLETEC